MKPLAFFILFLFSTTPVYAASCSDAQNAADAAVRERNALVRESHNTMMPDPEDVRGPFADCLSGINSIGDVFSMGVSFPSMDQIIAGMCQQVDSLIQDKMHEVLSEVRSTTGDIGRNNPFQVSGGGDIGISLSGRLK